MLVKQQKLVHKLLELEKRVGERDDEIASLFEAIRQLMQPPKKTETPDRLSQPCPLMPVRSTAT